RAARRAGRVPRPTAAAGAAAARLPRDRSVGVRPRARDRAERGDDLAHERAAPVLEHRAAARAPDRERCEPSHRRSARIRNDLRAGARQLGQPDRADVERAVPRGRRRGRAARAAAPARGARPILGEVGATIADVQVRNRGTIGGNVCSNDPTNHLPPLMVALGAEMVIAGAGAERTVKAEDFFLGVYLTAAGPGEVLTKIRI